MVRKSDVVRAAVASKNYKEALKLAKDFRIGVTEEQRSTMARAYECMAVSPEFYKSIGLDVNECIKQGIEVIISIYG